MAKRTRVDEPPPIFPDLPTYLAETGDTQANVAKQVGTTQPQIARILKEGAVPRPALALRLAAYARIPLDSFTRIYLLKHPTNGDTR
jgi:transcriptional regulator with XRE-family HTH domain